MFMSADDSAENSQNTIYLSLKLALGHFYKHVFFSTVVKFTIKYEM